MSPEDMEKHEACIKKRREQVFASLLQKAAQEGAIERGMRNQAMQEQTLRCSLQAPRDLTLREQTVNSHCAMEPRKKGPSRKRPKVQYFATRIVKMGLRMSA